MKSSKLLLAIAAILLITGGIVSSGKLGFSWPTLGQTPPVPQTQVQVTNEESVVIDAVDRVSPAVVTIGIKGTRRGGGVF